MKQLKNLNLSNNEISAIWAKTFDLVNLEVLTINNNKLTSLPRQIENLKKLKKLSISSNRLQSLPVELGKLGSLQVLNIANNDFNNFPIQILSLSELKKLWIGKNNFSVFPKENLLQSLPNLNSLYCFNPQSNPDQNLDQGFSVLQKHKGNVIDTLKLMAFNDNKAIDSYTRSKDAGALKHIFISYSHKDVEYKNEIVTSLRGLQYAGFEFEYWSDDQIKPGDEWIVEIENALDRAGIAIFIVSRFFMASEFIQKKELPKLLDKAQKDGTKILSVIAGKCAFQDSPIGKYQAINTPNTPLNSLKEHEQDAVYYNLVQDIKKHVNRGKQ